MVRAVGVEEEFLLVDSSGRGLAPAGDRVARHARDGDDDPAFEHELMQEQAESGSRPATSLTDLGADLRHLRRRLSAAAARHGALLLPSATSPVAGRHHTTADARYRSMVERYGDVALQQLACGMHVHVDIASPEEGVAVIDRIRPWLAVLVALSANSPLHGGADTGYHSFRTLLWSRWPTAGPTETFGDLATYRAVTAALVGSGAALDDGMVYFDARLSARYPTVEVRVADVCARVDDAVVVAGLVRALVETAASQADRPAPVVPVGVLRAAAWRAAHDATTSELVRPGGDPVTAPAWEVVDALVRHVEPALTAAGDLDLVTNGLERIRAQGTGSLVQRAAFATGGAEAAVEAVLELAG